MPRPYHSISSVKLGQRCAHAWALCYLDGIREPEIAWDDPKAPWLNVAGLTDAQKRSAYRARSKALGVATHAVFEDWQAHRPVNWRTLPGEVALSGAHHVPHPERVHEARVEAPIGKVPLPRKDTACYCSDYASSGLPCSPGKCPNAPGPRVAYELHGVLWAGYRDLLVSAPGEFVRLGIDAPDGWALYDYKTTASIDEYALIGDALRTDPQACLYVAATCDELGLDELPVRWLYLETKKRRVSLAVDATIRRDDAKREMIAYAETAKALDRITCSADAPRNVSACGEYGGCVYHTSAGGPCNARRSPGALMQARVRKDTMALSPTTKAAFEGFKAKNGAAQSPPTTDVDVSAEAEAPAGPTEPADIRPPAATKPRAKKSTGAVAANSPAASIAKLSAELLEAQHAADEANARVSALLGAIREACG